MQNAIMRGAESGVRKRSRFLSVAMVAALMGSLMAVAVGANAAVQPAPGIVALPTQYAQAKNSTSITVTTTADVKVGDVSLIHIGAAADNVSAEPDPSIDGMKLVNVNQSSSLLKSWVYSHVATKAGAQSFTITFSKPLNLGATLSTYRGVDRYRPVDAESSLKTGTSTTLTSPAVTTSTGNAKAVWFGSQIWDAGSCPVIQTPLGFTATGALCTVPDKALSLTVADRQLGVAALHSAWTAESNFPYTNIAQVVVLRPEAAASAPRGSTTAAVTTPAATPTESIEVSKPAETKPGDVLLAHVSTRNSISASVTAPEGWHLVPTDSGTVMQSSYSIRSWIFYRVATGAEPDKYVFSASMPVRMTAMVSAFSGVDTLHPIDSMEGKVNSSTAALNSNTEKPNSLTGNGTRLVWYATQTIDAGEACQTLTPPAGFSTLGTACMLEPYAGLASIASYSGRLPATKFAFHGTSSASATNIVEMVGLRLAPAVSEVNEYAAASTVVGKIPVATKAELWEASGVASSRINSNVVYVHSEEDFATMLAVDARGTSNGDLNIVGRYTLDIPKRADGVTAMFDWEDIAVGPCPSGSCVYAGDVGRSRNSARPEKRLTVNEQQIYTIWRTPEPVTSATPVTNRTTLPVEAFHFVYPEGLKEADSEAIMVHPNTGEIYVVTKAAEYTSTATVYKFPAGAHPSASPDDITTLVKVTTIELPITSLMLGAEDVGKKYSGLVTAASVHPDGNRFLLNTVHAVYEFTVPAGGSFDSAFATAPRKMTEPVREGNQREAIDYASDGSGYFSIDEKYTGNEQEAVTHTLQRVDRK